MPLALDTLFCTRADVEAMASVYGVDLMLEDYEEASPTATEEAYLDKMIQWGCAEVYRYLGKKYDADQLALSWEVNEWATICVLRRVRSRRGNSPPAIIQELYEQAVVDMKEIGWGEGTLPDIAERSVDTPSVSNIRVDTRYGNKKIRVQRPLSDPRPLPGRKNRDIEADLYVEPG
jgi:hypothetical protein